MRALTLIVGLAASTCYANTDINQLRENYVFKARNGDVNNALEGLLSLYRQTLDHKVLNDLIAIDSWDGQFQFVLSACGSCSANSLSPQSLEILAKAFRNQGELQRAQTFYSQLTQIEPANREGWLGLALVSAERNDLTESRRAFNYYQRHFVHDGHFYQTQVYIARALDDQVGEVFALQRWYQAEPDNREVGIAFYKAALRLGAAPAVSDLLNSHPDWFGPVDQLWFDYYAATTQLKNGRRAQSDQALGRSAQSLQRLREQIPSQHPLYRPVTYDLLTALVALEDYQQAEPVARYMEPLPDLPNYARLTLADYWLATDRPEAASKVYAMAYEKAPSDSELKTKLYNSYMDSEQFDAANAVLKQAIVSTPATRWDYTGSVRLTNDNYQNLQLLNAMHYAARGDMQTSEKLLDQLYAQAPGNPYLILTMGDFENWRGNQDKAIAYYQQARALLAEENHALVDKATLMANAERGAWDQVAEQRDAINQRYPRMETRQINRVIDQKEAAYIQGEFRHGRSDGATINASKDWRYDAYLYSQRALGGARLFVHDQQSFGMFDQRDLYARYFGLGGEWVSYPLTLTAELGQGAKLNEKSYFWLNGDYRGSDNWSFSLSYRNNSADTPLRALKNDTYVDDVIGSVRYRWSDALLWGASFAYADFTDDNQRYTALTWLDGELYRNDVYRLRSALYLGQSRNEDIPQAEYFNPLEDRYASLSLTQIYHQRLADQLSLDHQLVLSTGPYWQQSYGSEWNWDVNYQQSWQVSHRATFAYGAGRSKTFYDGDGEYNDYLFVNFVVSFAP